MPVVFQQMPMGNLLGVAWFGLLFFAGITSSVSMLTPTVAFFREEFGFRREQTAWILGGVCLLFGLMHVQWLQYGFLDDWDFWGGTFGLVVLALIETIVFVWIFKPANAWASIHEGADIRIPRIFKFIMTFVTPIYLLAIMGTWAVQDALPILAMEGVAEENRPFILISRLIMLGFIVAFLILIRIAWKRNRYDDRVGFVEVENTPAGIAEGA